MAKRMSKFRSIYTIAKPGFDAEVFIGFAPGPLQNPAPGPVLSVAEKKRQFIVR